MKSRLKLDQWVDASALTEQQKSLVKFKTSPGSAPVPYFPEGTIFEGRQAVLLCRTGQAEPIDEECADACGMSADQLASKQVEYKMDTLGISDVGDRELYRVDVILGYNKDGEKIHGPNWQAYQDAKKENEIDELA